MQSSLLQQVLVVVSNLSRGAIAAAYVPAVERGGICVGLAGYDAVSYSGSAMLCEGCMAYNSTSRFAG